VDWYVGTNVLEIIPVSILKMVLCCAVKFVYIYIYIYTGLIFWGGRRGTRTPKHFVNLMGKSKNFRMLEFPLNQLQTYYGYLCDLCPLSAFIFFRFELQNGDFLESNLEYP
jgi:hypothetical protein